MSVRRSWRIVRQMLQLTYENLGFVMMLSALWFMIAWSPLIVLSFLPGLRDNVVAQIGALVLSLLVPFGPATAAVVSLTFDLTHQEPVELRDFFPRARQHLWPSLGLMATNVIVGVILAIDLWFAFVVPNQNIRLFAWVWIYLALLWVAMVQLHFPLLVRQEDTNWITIWKTSAIMTIGNIGFSLLALVATLLLWTLNIGLVAGTVLFMGGTTGLLHNLYLSELIRYGRQQAAKRSTAPARSAGSPDSEG